MQSLISSNTSPWVGIIISVLQTRQRKGIGAQTPSSVVLSSIKKPGIPLSLNLAFLHCWINILCYWRQPDGGDSNTCCSSSISVPPSWFSTWKETALCLAWLEAGGEGLERRGLYSMVKWKGNVSCDFWSLERSYLNLAFWGCLLSLKDYVGLQETGLNMQLGLPFQNVSGKSYKQNAHKSCPWRKYLSTRNGRTRTMKNRENTCVSMCQSSLQACHRYLPDPLTGSADLVLLFTFLQDLLCKLFRSTQKPFCTMWVKKYLGGYFWNITPQKESS